MDAISLSAFAPSKLNLGLRVLGKRSDGYHEILSVFQAVDLYDQLEISISRRDRDDFTCSGLKISGEGDNTILRTVQLFRERFKVDGFFRIFLKKRIPVGAGMGGGSSDAATAIHLLSQLARLNLSDEKIGEIAAAIGSDVFFFARTSGENTAVVRGRGERMEFIKWPFSVHYVVVYPGIQISSSWAYYQISGANRNRNTMNGKNQTDKISNPSQTSTRIATHYEKCVERLTAHTIGVEEFFQSLVNDLETPVLMNYPILERIKKLLIGLGAVTALMTGSGSAVYGVFPGKKEADAAAKSLRARSWTVFGVRPVPVNEGGKNQGMAYR